MSFKPPVLTKLQQFLAYASFATLVNFVLESTSGYTADEQVPLPFTVMGPHFFYWRQQKMLEIVAITIMLVLLIVTFVRGKK